MKSFKIRKKNLGRSTGNNQDIHFYEETSSDNKRNEVYKFFYQKEFIEKGTSLNEPWDGISIKEKRIDTSMPLV
jgi:hypothetical protein